MGHRPGPDQADPGRPGRMRPTGPDIPSCGLRGGKMWGPRASRVLCCFTGPSTRLLAIASPGTAR